jgi:hypothetical protein
MGLDTAISLELTKLNKQISDLQGQVRALTEQRDAWWWWKAFLSIWQESLQTELMSTKAV